MTAQSNPNNLVRTAVNNAFERMLRAGVLPAVEYKFRPSGNCSYDNTEYNKHWSSFMKIVDAKLKQAGFRDGIHQKTSSPNYAATVSLIVKDIKPEAVIRGMKRELPTSEPAIV
jgi:hypothetical protein